MSQALIWNSQNSNLFFSQIIHWIDSAVLEKSHNNTPFVIAIDGQCGSGKSTLAKLLQTHYRGNLFHMDDYYLPWVLKTPERLNEPGGNVHYERFREEVLQPLVMREPICYQPYDCKSEQLMPSQGVSPKAINFVEGSYSMHPSLIDHYNLKIVLTISEDIQMRRILLRNGDEGLKRFKALWIPLENAYFENCGICEKADLIIQVVD